MLVVLESEYSQIKCDCINLVSLIVEMFFLQMGLFSEPSFKIQPQFLLHEKCFCPSVMIFALDMYAGNSCFLTKLQISFFLTLFAFAVGIVTSSSLKV